MLNFYQIVRDNLSFNRFQYDETVCLEYTCPLDAEEIGIFSRNDYLVHVLSGKKTYKTIDGDWTLVPGQTLYLKKGAEIIHQFFDDEYCMLAFFLSDDLIKQTFGEVKGSSKLNISHSSSNFTGEVVHTTPWLETYFHSMLAYFRGEDRPPDRILLMKLKELLLTLMDSNPNLTSYFSRLTDNSGPSINDIMEQNYCFNLSIEDYAELTHRSLSSFKRDFQKLFNDTPGKWILKRRVARAANLLQNTDLTVSEVAYDSGFEDLSHFSRAFKQIIGVNPSEYRKS